MLLVALKRTLFACHIGENGKGLQKQLEVIFTH